MSKREAERRRAPDEGDEDRGDNGGSVTASDDDGKTSVDDSMNERSGSWSSHLAKNSLSLSLPSFFLSLPPPLPSSRLARRPPLGVTASLLVSRLRLPPTPLDDVDSLREPLPLMPPTPFDDVESWASLEARRVRLGLGLSPAGASSSLEARRDLVVVPLPLSPRAAWLMRRW